MACSYFFCIGPQRQPEIIATESHLGNGAAHDDDEEDERDSSAAIIEVVPIDCSRQRLLNVPPISAYFHQLGHLFLL